MSARWEQLRAEVAATQFKVIGRVIPDPRRALHALMVRDARKAQDDALEEAYEADRDGNPARHRYLMNWAGQHAA